MKTFLIAGSIVDTDSDKETFEDVTPVQVNAFLNKLEPDEEAVLEITSYGGSVTAGLAICNLFKKASAEGHKTTAHVIGIAASMASAIACACDELKIDANAFMMVHNPWTITMGNADDMRKEADTLDKYRDALLAVYRSKFDMSDDMIKAMLDAETWIIGEQAPMFKLSAEVIPTAEPLRAAAFAKSMPKFMKTPKALREIIKEKQDLTTKAVLDMEDEQTKQADETVEKEEAVVETKAEETQAETVVEEPKEETPEAENIDVAETVTKAEADRRVSGMQSAMAKQMDAMKKDYEAKIQDFQIQIKAKDEELTKARAEVTSLSERLEKSEKELSETASALAEKENALAVLNAGVNTPNETTDWKSLKGEAFFDWVKAHPECLKK